VHYPPDADFINVCDSLGIYVLDELTGWHGAYDDTAGRKLVKEMVTRDVNHPAVMIWDNGNEGGWNVHLDNDYALYDPQNRTVIHPWAVLNGTNTKHYPDYAYLQKSVATEQDVFFPTEFMHALYDGGAAAGLDDFWNLMMIHPHSAGGFIWALLDEAVMRTDKNGAYDTDGNHAPDGIVGPHREKEGSFYAIKEIWSPVHIDTPVLDKTFKGKLSIANRYSFTNLNQCRFSWKLVKLPSAKDKSTAGKPLVVGKPALLNLAPGQKGVLNLGLPATWQQADALYVTAYGPDKKEIFTWSWAIKSPAAISKSIEVIAKTKVKTEEAGNTLMVKCDGNKYLFDKTTGYIQKVVKAGVEVSLSNGPVLAGVKTSLASFTNSTVNGAQVVEADYKGDGALHVKWTFASGKPVKLDYTYSQTGDADFIGITFNYPEEKITGMKWLGRGPYREWKNRLKGQQFGVWHKAYNTAVTGEAWQYPEFTGFHGEVNWAVIENKESPFTVYTDDKNMYLQMLRPKREKDALANNNVEPAFPDGNIGFMTAISPIGTKFQAAKVMGPQSQKNVPSATPVSGTLWFDFGK